MRGLDVTEGSFMSSSFEKKCDITSNKPAKRVCNSHSCPFTSAISRDNKITVE